MLADYEDPELANLSGALDVAATYDKPGRRLRLAPTVTPELVAAQEANRLPKGRPRSRISSIAGGAQ